MDKDYIFSHDWGSYDSNNSVNKINLRNEQDVKKYLSWVLTVLYNAKVNKDLLVTFVECPKLKVKLNLSIFKA